MAVTTTITATDIASAYLVNNVVTGGTQAKPALTRVGANGYAAGWNDGAASGEVQGRFYSDFSTPVASEFTLNSTTTNLQSNPSLATLSSGQVVAAYVDASASTTAIRARVFSATGTPAAADFLITGTYTAPPQGSSQPDVAVLTNGNFVVAFTSDFGSNDLDAQFGIYSPAGAKIAGGDTNTGSVASFMPSVAALTNGGFVMVWTETPAAGGNQTLYYRRYSATGAAVDNAPVLDDNTGTINSDAQVIGLADGGFAIAFTDNGWNSGADGSDITLKIYNANGTIRYGGARINTTVSGDQTLPAITQLDGGIIVVSWSDAGNTRLRAFRPDGTALSSSDASFISGGGGIGELELVAAGPGQANTLLSFSGDMYSLPVNFVRTSVGDAAADTIVGDELIDRITGGGGADQLTGGAGADIFAYNAISDSTSGAQDYITDFASGVDKISLSGAVGTGGVVAIGRAGSASTVYFQRADGVGGAGQIGVNGVVQGYDFTVSATTVFVINGDNGNDVIYGSANLDYINGGGGTDNILGGLGADQLTGGAGSDYFYYNSIAESSTSSADYITDFASGSDKIVLSAIGAGGVVAIGRSGSTSTIYFQRGDGVGGAGQIGVNGVVQGTDFIVDPSTVFVINGDNGNDVIYGSSGVDYINGGGGVDNILGGLGADQLTGGAGSDYFYYSSVAESTSAAQDYITDFTTGVDSISLGGAIGSGGVVAIGRSGSTSTIYFQRGDGVGGTGQIGVNGVVQGSDFIVPANTVFVINGDNGNDVIYGSSGLDYINGGGGTDNILGGLGADQLTGGAGSDYFYYNSIAESTSAAADYITDFASGSDKISLAGALGSGGAVAIGRSGSTSTIYFQRGDGVGGTGQIGVNGTVQGYDLIISATTTVYITGDNGSDVIYGSSGVDVINGGGGDDNILGGLGADQLTGGTGTDYFYYSSVAESTAAARDTLLDFATGVDKISIAALGPGQVTVAYNGTNTIVTFDPSGGGTALSIFAIGQVRFSDIVAGAGVSFTGNGAPLGDPAVDYAPAPVGYDASPAVNHGLI